MPALHPVACHATAMAAMEAAMPEAWDGVLVGANLATLDGDAGYAAIEDGALGWREGRIVFAGRRDELPAKGDRKSTRLNSSHVKTSYAVFCLKKKIISFW